MDAAKWSQGFHDIGLVKAPPMEDMVISNTSTSTSTRPLMKTRPAAAEQLNCPRCNSTNTKFCYYNNYSLTQPRYLCKACRRYWTEGGSLRNVPVGGGSRKNKRSSSTFNSSSFSSPSKLIPDLNPTTCNFSQLLQNPINKGQDLNLGFPAAMQESRHNYPSANSALELLRSSTTTGMSSSREIGLNSLIPAHAPAPDSATLYSSTTFSMQDYKLPTLSFSIDGLGNRVGFHGVHQENNGGAGGRLFFPFGDQMKTISSTNEVDQNKGQQAAGSSAGYWNNGALGGGSW